MQDFGMKNFRQGLAVSDSCAIIITSKPHSGKRRFLMTTVWRKIMTKGRKLTIHALLLEGSFWLGYFAYGSFIVTMLTD